MEKMSSTVEYDAEAIDISMLATKDINTVEDLLDVLELSKWSDLFIKEDINLATLFYVTDEHLIQLGLTLSERIKLLRCLQILKDVPPPPSGMAGLLPPPKLQTSSLNNKRSFEQRSDAVERAKQVIPKYEEIEEETKLIEEEEVLEEEIFQSDGEDNIVNQSIEDELNDNGIGIVASTAIPFRSSYTPCHSRVFIRSELEGISKQLCSRLQEAFEDELKASKVAYVPSNDSQQIMNCLNIFLDDSSETDDLLWVVFSGNAVDESLYSSLFDSVETKYKGGRVFYVLDDAIPSSLSSLPTSTKHQLFALTSTYSEGDNPCYLTLHLLDALRGKVCSKENPSPYTLREFSEEALSNLKFLSSTSRVAIKRKYSIENGFNLEDLCVLAMAPQVKSVNVLVGKRGIYENRPIQIIDMNGTSRVQIRFLNEDCDTEWVNITNIDVENGDEETSVEEVLTIEEINPKSTHQGIGISDNTVDEIEQTEEIAPVEEVQIEEVVPNEEFVEEAQIEEVVPQEELVEEAQIEEVVPQEEFVEEAQIEEVVPQEDFVEEAQIEEVAPHEDFVEEVQVEEVALHDDELVEEVQIEEPVTHEELLMEQEELLQIEEEEIRTPMSIEETPVVITEDVIIEAPIENLDDTMVENTEFAESMVIEEIAPLEDHGMDEIPHSPHEMMIEEDIEIMEIPSSPVPDETLVETQIEEMTIEPLEEIMEPMDMGN